MLMNTIFFYFVLYCSAYVMVKIIKGAKDDIIYPKEILKKYTTKKFRTIIYLAFMVLLVSVFAVSFISDIPVMVNRDFFVQSGKIQETVLLGEKKGIKQYNVVVECKEGIKEIDNVYAEILIEGMDVSILCSSNPFFKNIVSIINGEETEYYQKYQDSFVDKVVLMGYVLLNVFMYRCAFKKDKFGKVFVKRELILYRIWKYALCIYSVLMSFSVINMINNVVLGILVAFSYEIYNICYLLFLLSVESKEQE